MFGKIKDRLKNVFSKSEELIEENPDEEIVVEDQKEEIIEEQVEKPKSKPKKEKPKKEEKEELDEEEFNLEEPKDEVKRELEEQVEKKPKSKPKKEKPKKEEPEDLDEEEFNLEEPRDEIKRELEEKTVEKEEKKEEEEQPKKKGFFSKLFHKKEDDEEKEIEEIQEDMLEGTSDEEKKAIKEHKDLDKEEVEKNKKNLEKQIDKEDELEKETLEEKKEDEGFLSKTFTKLKAKKITEDDFEKIWVELQIFLLEINIAYEIVEKIEKKLRTTLIGNSFDRFRLSKKIREVLEDEVEEVLKDREADFLEDIKKIRDNGEIAKILVLGVNGTGKTTTIAKIVYYLQKNNLSVVVAAADTFRAAAVEQLEEHSKKLNFKLIKHKGGSDPAAVSYDAVEHAKSKNIDVVLVDTAGRMPNNSNLMLELQKVKRVSQSQMAIFIGDSISGNDLIDQINLFDKGVAIDGVVLTKVDTDEKPGSIVTTAYSIEKPIYFLGCGQTYDDLVKFDSRHIAEKLFEIDDEE